MVELELGDAITNALPLVFESQSSALAGDWHQLVGIGNSSEVEVKLLIYSNSSAFDAYLQANLWSDNYFD